MLAEAGETPVVALAATEDDPAALQATGCGAQDLLLKHQIDDNVLHRLVRYAVEQRRSQGQSRLGRELPQQMTADNPDGLVVIDQRGVIRFANPAAEALFGTDASQLVGRVFAFPIEAGGGKFEIICASGRTAVAELRTVKRDWLEAEVSVLTLRAAGEPQKTSEDLQQAQQFESISLLAGGIAHEFNSLLGIIMGYIELAQNALEPGSPAFENLVTACRAVSDAKKLTRRFIAISRRAEPEKRPLSIEQELHKAMEVIGADGCIRFETAVQKGLWPVEADQGQLRRVFLNLFENARESMPQGGTIRTSAVNITVDEEM